MSWHLAGLAAAAPMPWRNGGGVTRELAAGPGGAQWAWRMSVADVDASGPFSVFDGIDRWFAVLEGDGVRLDIAGEQHRLTATDAPLYFDGGASCVCELLGGGTRDFNLMVRRATPTQPRSRMSRMNGQWRQTATAAGVVAVYTVNAGAQLHCGGETLALPAATLAWRRAGAGMSVDVSGGSALWMEIPE